mgnify:CR=1 FL=1
MTAPRPEWWLRLAERAAQPPLRPRRPLRFEAVASAVGSIEARLAYHLRAAHLPLVSLSLGAMDLEQVFLALTGTRLRD